MNHAIGLVFTDAQVSIWWHDRESTIQSSTIDIETELSKLVVLLVILQRFSHIDWGFSAGLESSVDGTILIVVDKHVFRATIRPEDLGTRRGRGTFTSRVSDVSNPSFDYFMKATFVDAEADGESAIIKKCHELAQGDTMILDHIPKVVAAQTFPELATSRIRRQLNLGSTGSRMPCILVFEQLEPITALPPELLWSAIWDIVRCHFLLWQLGVHHRDISVGNLMYNASTGKGILNDFDLAVIVDLSEIPAPCPRTTFGTVPFMALELLAAPQSKSQAFHLYRHDLESFTWTLLWICTGYSHKTRSRADPLADVFSDDRVWSYRAKYDASESFVIDPAYSRYAALILAMVSMWQDIEFARLSARSAGARVQLFMPQTPYCERPDDFYLSWILESAALAGTPVDLGIELPDVSLYDLGD
ncbi:hypothetical protein C8J56DRAFT_885744 [Mycena floridula]|nr:hypothetical protein C8J56DRAFT_885744 [Mycena floridula]